MKKFNAKIICSAQSLKTLAVISIFFITMSTFASIDITNSEFVLKLGGDWVSVPSADTNQFSFESKSNKTSVVLSLMPLKIPQDKLTGVATKFAEIRQKAEQDSRPGQTIHWGDKWVQLRPTGDVAEVAYAGYDDKMIFRFFGFVTQRKVLSFWVATETRENDLSKEVFDVVYRGLKFYVP